MKYAYRLQMYLAFPLLLLSLLILYFPTLHQFSATSGSQEYEHETILQFSNLTVLNNGIPESKFFSNESSLHNWLIENITLGQVVYLSISPQSPFTKSEFEVNLFLPSGQNFNSILEETLVSSKNFFCKWTALSGGNWIVQVNDTRILRIENVSYEIMISVPENLYDEQSAIEINELFHEANFTIPHEIHYWKIWLNENQNSTVFLKETNLNVLFKSKITIYTSINGPQNPILSRTEITGSYNYSWRAFVSDNYFVVIEHHTEDVAPIGSYNISVSAQKLLYSFDTAERLIYNQTNSVRITQGYFPAQKFFFWFKVNISGTDVFIHIYEENASTSIILDYALVDVYDEGRQNRINYTKEENSAQDGYINLIQKDLSEGIYYLIITPQPNAIGVFIITFEYELPSPFTWSLLTIFINITILIVLPISLIYIDLKGKWYRINQWTVPNSVKETYKLFKYSFRGIFNLKEVPNDSILIQVASIPFKTFSIINFIESSERETLVFSKRIKRKIEWVIYFLVSFFIFGILNIISFLVFSEHFLPIYIPNLSNLLVILVIPAVLLVVIVLFVNISSYITYSQIVNRIAFIVKNYEDSAENQEFLQSTDPEQAAKGVNYVRVLWNQAKHAFKSQNFELFVIKADAAVKNLLSTRYMQLVSGNTYTKPDFQDQVLELRKRGFDLPNDKKITHFRNLRNKIVHSSITLDEKESVDCFAFYSTFISRLGLRPT